MKVLKEMESEIIDKERKQHLKSLQDISQVIYTTLMFV